MRSKLRGFGIDELDGNSVDEDQVAAPGDGTGKGLDRGFDVQLGFSPIVADLVEEFVEGFQPLVPQRSAQVAPKLKSREHRGDFRDIRNRNLCFYEAPANSGCETPFVRSTSATLMWRNSFLFMTAFKHFWSWSATWYFTGPS